MVTLATHSEMRSGNYLLFKQIIWTNQKTAVSYIIIAIINKLHHNKKL